MKTTLRRTLETLLTPRCDGADEWRDAVNRDLRHWTAADAAFLRVSDGSPTRLDPLVPELLDARDDYRDRGLRPHDPLARSWAPPGGFVIGTFTDLLGDRWSAAHPYAKDFLRPHRITGNVGAQITSEDGEHVEFSCFNWAGSRRGDVTDRTVRRLRAVGPALEAGLRVWLSARKVGGDFEARVDELADALLLCDARGRALHANSALARLAEGDPERHLLQDALHEVARDAAGLREADVHDLRRGAGERTFRTVRGLYRIAPVRAEGLLRGTVPDGVVLRVSRDAPPLRAARPTRRATPPDA